MSETGLPHILLSGPTNRNQYISPQSGGRGSFRAPTRDCATHSAYISRKLEEAWTESEDSEIAGHIDRSGVYLEFRGKEGHDLAIGSLEVLGINFIIRSRYLLKV